MARHFIFKNIFVAIFAISLLINSISLFYYTEFVGRRCTCSSFNPPDPTSTIIPANPNIKIHPGPPPPPTQIPTPLPTSKPTPPPTPEPTLAPTQSPDLTSFLPRPSPFSLYVIELPEEFTKAYYGWVDPLHTAFLNSTYRTLDVDKADFVIVPYYQTQAWSFYNSTRIGKDTFSKEFENRLLQWLKNQPHWQRYGGIDFVFWSEEINPFLDDHYMTINTIPFMRSGPISMLCELPVPKDYTELILFQRQIVIPYRETNPLFISEPYWSARPEKKYLIQFSGSISRYDHGKYVRTEILKYLNASAPDVNIFTYFEGGFEKNNTITEFLTNKLPLVMQQSVFCLAPHGDTPGARRMFDAIISRCIPVIVADDVRVPFYGLVNYSEFSIKVPEDRISTIEQTLRAIPKSVISAMMERLDEIRRYFVWNHPNAADAQLLTMLELEFSLRAAAMREHKHWVDLVKEHPQTQNFSTEFKMWKVK